jgi:diguanylate cyclase (GGDEF)-like protein/PAS domain S-box-containing protein
MPETVASRDKRRISVRYFFSLIIIAALLPPILLLAMVMIRTAQTDRQAAESSLVDNAKVIASMVHGTILSDVEMIRTIGRQASARSRAGEFAPELNIINRHFNGRASIATSPDIGISVLPPWSVTNLVEVKPGESARLNFTVPLEVVSGATLNLSADSAAIANKISFGDVAASGMLVAVVDGNGHMITRSVAAAENLGKPVPTWQALLDVGAPNGAFNAIAFDGTPISFGFATIEATPGWVVVVGMPKAILDARWQNPLVAFAFGTIIAVIIAVILALYLSQRITEPILAMVQRSRAIASNSTDPLPEAPDTVIRELDMLYRAQMDSHSRLAERAAELAISSKRYSAVAKVGAMVTWRTDLNGQVLDIEGWEDFTGAPTSSALGRGWTERVHPEDMPHLTATLRQAVIDALGTVTAEVRVLTGTEDWVWVNFRGAMITDANGKPAEWIGTLENINDRKRLQLRISHLAYHDSLTGLPNRIRLAEHFSELWSPSHAGQQGALLYVDLDKFKQANDTFGHAAGDALLRMVAERLGNILRDNDLAARLGGDEFAVVLGQLENDEYSIMAANRIIKAISAPFEVGGNRIEIGASIGIALFRAGEVSIERLQFEADSALYRAKAGGRNRYAFNTGSDDEQQRA